MKLSRLSLIFSMVVVLLITGCFLDNQNKEVSDIKSTIRESALLRWNVYRDPGNEVLFDKLKGYYQAKNYSTFWNIKRIIESVADAGNYVANYVPPVITFPDGAVKIIENAQGIKTARVKTKEDWDMFWHLGGSEVRYQDITVYSLIENQAGKWVIVDHNPQY